VGMQRHTDDDGERVDFLTHTHSYLQGQINLADAKAAVITGLAAGLFVAYREVTKDWSPASSIDLPTAMRGILQLPFLLLLAMTVIHGYLVLLPRVPDAFRRTGTRVNFLHRALEVAARRFSKQTDLDGGGGLIRWPEIANRSRYPTTWDYAEAVRRSSTDGLRTELAEHCAILARITADKFVHVGLALNYLVLAGFTMAVLTLLGQRLFS